MLSPLKSRRGATRSLLHPKHLPTNPKTLLYRRHPDDPPQLTTGDLRRLACYLSSAQEAHTPYGRALGHRASWGEHSPYGHLRYSTKLEPLPCAIMSHAYQETLFKTRELQPKPDVAWAQATSRRSTAADNGRPPTAGVLRHEIRAIERNWSH
jgi:hypothetical protein